MSSGWKDHPPPWEVFPGLDTSCLPATQGAYEPYFETVWRPFWTSLTQEQRVQYLDKWNATLEWREAIRFTFDPPDFDMVQDYSESQAHLAEWHRLNPPRRSSFWGWLRRK